MALFSADSGPLRADVETAFFRMMLVLLAVSSLPLAFPDIGSCIDGERV
jgi:hypothetical protein